jgi:TonB family protein
MPPKPGVEEMGRIHSRTTPSGGLVVGDIGQGIGGVGAGLNHPGAAPVPTQSALELMSDPMGVDFKPYLIRILATVRRNWLSVIPESARMGRRGKVQIQFAINKDGSVPKLVIALPSGTESLDRAAVAGISASNPFPPLPDEFRGQQVRLQFTFLYNIPR